MTQHHTALAHHFDTPEQQKEAATLGMWLFLATEIMLFGGIFMGYIVYRWAYPEVFSAGSHHLNLALGTVNTLILLCSSLTVALAVHAAEEGKRRVIVNLLLATIVLGAVFLGIKGVEYYQKFAECWAPASEECLVPGRSFFYPTETTHTEGAASAESPVSEAAVHSETASRPYQIFFLLYFIATGLHAFHMVVGISLMGVIVWMANRGRFSAEYYTPVEMSGLYWHLIDIIWVFLFPLFYLIH